MRDDRARAAAKACDERRGRRPSIYSGTEHVWEEMVDGDDIDVVYISTPWIWHVPMCLRAMAHGKHALVEERSKGGAFKESVQRKAFKGVNT